MATTNPDHPAIRLVVSDLPPNMKVHHYVYESYDIHCTRCQWSKIHVGTLPNPPQREYVLADARKHVCPDLLGIG